MNYGQLALARAEKYVGTKEAPADSNDGPMVRIFEAVTGAFKQPWCASFVMFALNLVGYPVVIFSRSAYVPFVAARARQLGYAVSVRSIQPGDVVCFDWQHDGVPDHIGIANSTVAVDGLFTTIEGNTSYGNDSNGGEVMQRTRRVSDVHTAFRLPEKPGSPKESVPIGKPLPKAWPTPIPAWFWAWATWKLHGSKVGRRPKSAPRTVPLWAWRRLAALKKGRLA